jgi:hypothetical protein
MVVGKQPFDDDDNKRDLILFTSKVKDNEDFKDIVSSVTKKF